MTTILSVGITTRDRRASLKACLDSLQTISALSPEVIVFDDGSNERVEDLAAAAPMPVSVIRDPNRPGYIVGRNRLVEAAHAEFVLLLDDDTRVLSSASVEQAMRVLQEDQSVGAVGFAQAEADGRPWPEAMQPSTAAVPVIVPAFIGFAHLLRRSIFQRLGGYRESFQFYGEEKEYGLRLIDAGYKTVYLPGALVAHVIDRASRDPRRYLRMVARNDCLNTLYNDPIDRALWMLPARFVLYFRMRRGWRISDPGGGWWLLRDVCRRLPAAMKARKPVSRRTLARWRELRASHVAYQPPPGRAAETNAG